jgi:hypothetical protein
MTVASLGPRAKLDDSRVTPPRKVPGGIRTMRKSLWIIPIFLATCFAPAAMANITYSYVGNAYTSCSGAYAVPGTSTCNGNYFVSGSFTLDQALADNLSGLFLPGNIGQTDSGYTLLGFSYADNGPITLSGNHSAFGTLHVWTNGSGAIDNWAISVFTDNGAPSGICATQFCQINTVNLPAADTSSPFCLEGPGSTLVCTYDNSAYFDPAGGTNSNNAGTWKTELAPVPEPSSVGLILCGMGLLLATRKRWA